MFRSEPPQTRKKQQDADKKQDKEEEELKYFFTWNNLSLTSDRYIAKWKLARSSVVLEFSLYNSFVHVYSTCEIKVLLGSSLYVVTLFHPEFIYSVHWLMLLEMYFIVIVMDIEKPCGNGPIKYVKPFPHIQCANNKLSPT